MFPLNGIMKETTICRLVKAVSVMQEEAIQAWLPILMLNYLLRLNERAVNILLRI